MDDADEIFVTRVANGYVLRVRATFQNNYHAAPSDTYAFESLQALETWLRNEFRPKAAA